MDGSRFDIFYVFDLQKDGTYKFSQVPQMALVGDKTNPMPSTKSGCTNCGCKNK